MAYFISDLWNNALESFSYLIHIPQIFKQTDKTMIFAGISCNVDFKIYTNMQRNFYNYNSRSWMTLKIRYKR